MGTLAMSLTELFPAFTGSALLSKVDILCVQEHWLSELQLSFLGSINDRFGYTGVSGFDNAAREAVRWVRDTVALRDCG